MEPELFLPGTFTDPSGLTRVVGHSGELGSAQEAEVVRRIMGPGGAVAVARPPAFIDQVHVFATHQELLGYMEEASELTGLGLLRDVTAERLIRLVSELPFAPAMRFVSTLQRELAFIRRDIDGQRALLHSIYGEGAIATAGEAFLRRHERGAIFSEQQLFAVQRLLVLQAGESGDESLTKEQDVALRTLLLCLPGVFLNPGEKELGESESVEDEEWLRYFIGNGGFVAHGSLMHEIARANLIYGNLAKSRLVREHPDFCPLDRWLEDTYGMTFLELQAFGFVILVGSRTISEGEPPLTVDKAYFESTALRDRVDEGFAAIAANRDWYREEFERSEETPRRIAFETQPFLRRPGLLQADGTVLVVAPRAVQAWLGASGTYYRLFDIARAKGDEIRLKFTRFNGALQESYARHLMHVAHPYPERRGAFAVGKVHGPRPYRKGRGTLDSTDVAIDLGLDLVLIEITAGRLTERSLVEADAESVKKDLEKMVDKKVRQLARVIGDVFDDPARLPDIDLTIVQRVWPVVVCGDGLFQNPTIAAYTESLAAEHMVFAPGGMDATVQPIVILDFEELEVLGGMVEAGISLIELLENKTSDVWRARDFKAMISDWYPRRWDERPAFISAEYLRASRGFVRVLRIGPHYT